jgi:hypothetical protein
VTPNSDWWDRAKLPPRPQPIEVRKRQPICTLRQGEHQIPLEKREVPTMGEELILSVSGHWRRMRVFRSGRTQIRSCTVTIVLACACPFFVPITAKNWRISRIPRNRRKGGFFERFL